MHLKKSNLRTHRNILCRNRLLKIRMIEKTKSNIARLFRLLFKVSKIYRHRLAYAFTIHRLNRLVHIQGIHMYGELCKLMGDFFCRNKKKLARLFVQLLALFQSFKPYQLLAIHHLFLNPSWPKPIHILLKRLALITFSFFRRSPLVPLCKQIMLRQCQELVAMGFVPVRNHIRVIIAIAP